MYHHTDKIFLGVYTSNKAWIFNFETEIWAPIPDLPQTVSNTHAGLATHPNGNLEVVVTAGLSSAATQIFSISSWSWRMGPSFPIASSAGGESVQYEDSFLVVGGGTSTKSFNAIYKYNLDPEGWIELPQKMRYERNYFAAFLVPDDFFD